MQAVNLLIIDANGVYIPQRFVQEFLEPNKGEWKCLNPDDVDICAAGPDAEGYWEAWDDILQRAAYIDADGHTYCLWQDGDLWLLDISRMTQQEKDNFGFRD